MRSPGPLVFVVLFSLSLIVTAHEPADKSKLLEAGQASKLSNPAASTEIKIVSYNIRWRSDKKLQQIIDWLKDKNQRPAIIALQEVDRAKKRTGNINTARALAEGLGMYYAWAAPPGPQSQKASEEETGVELLSPYPLTNITRIVLPHKGPGGRWRVALGATVRIGKLSLRVYSVHSETRIPVSRKIEQLGAVLDDLGHYPATPAIVMGDFNSWEPATKSRIRKLFSSAGFTTPFSDDHHTFMRSAILFDLELKLDWMWLRGLPASSSYGIDRSIKVSDHFPLWMVVSGATQSD